MIAERLVELGIELPPVSPRPATTSAAWSSATSSTSGATVPIGGPERFVGKVGTDLTLEDGYRAARATGLSILATLAAVLGDLDRIERIVKVFGMVNVAPGFNRTPAVIDGCSDLLVEVFGEAGRHTRSAVGLAELPFDIPVEIELIARLRT